MRSVVPFRRVLTVLLVLALGTLHAVSGAGRPQAQSAAGQAPRFGGAYSGSILAGSSLSRTGSPASAR
jgi:hypothetical protein